MIEPTLENNACGAVDVEVLYRAVVSAAEASLSLQRAAQRRAHNSPIHAARLGRATLVVSETEKMATTAAFVYKRTRPKGNVTIAGIGV